MNQNGEKMVRIINKEANVTLSSLYEKLQCSSGMEDCGAIVSFTGVVRGRTEEGTKVKRLHYESEKEIALKRLKEIRLALLRKYDEVKDLLIYHIVDDLRPKEEIMFVLAASRHREQAFTAVRESVEKIKSKVPIWKKEIREDKDVWIGSSHMKKEEEGK